MHTLPVTRRSALRLVGGALVGGLLSSGCRGNCEGAAPLEPSSKAIRQALGYVESSNLSGKACKSCAQFLGGTAGGCGGCRLFSGGVNPDGVCQSWVAAPRG